MKRIFLLVILVIATATMVLGQERYVKPVDEATKAPSFLAFRKKLIAAAERKDVAYLLSVIHPRIKNGFGGDDGLANFKRQWKITSKTSRFWKEFLIVIRNGGQFTEDGSFMAPYTFSSWPDDIDGFEYQVIFGNNVNLRKSPEPRSEAVAQLSYNIVQIESETLPKSGKSEYPGWWFVRTLGGLRGYVKQEYVRSHIDYRAGFSKSKGVWKLDFFLAGD